MLELITAWLSLGSIIVVSCLQFKRLRDQYCDVVINSNLYLAAGSFAHVVAFLALCVIWPKVLLKAFREWNVK